jgi:Zn-dependent M28 family amino/carboxypeptidase
MKSRLWIVPAGVLAALAAAWFVVTQPGVMPGVTHPPEVDAERLKAHVRHLSVDLHPRAAGPSGRLDAVADYVAAELRASGAEVRVQAFSVGPARHRNLVARFGPADGAPLVIGAHYDSHDGSHDDSEGDATPGADDNASGVAGLLELARLLARDPPPRPVELVAYTLEEPPYFRSADMGSAVHAQSLRAAGREPRLMLALEMIGTFSDEPGSQRYPVAGMPLVYGDRGDFIAVVGRLERFGMAREVKAAVAGASALRVQSINAPTALQGIDFSDHLSYWALGMPALMVTDTAFLRNRHYHEAGDSWEKLDYRRMAQVVQGVWAVTRAL